jgi:acetaldehyde dehydrogenase/alcohol dehydrogenase
VLDEFPQRHGSCLTDAEAARLEPVAVDAATGMMTSAVVGKPAAEIARMAGIDVPAGVELLIAPLGGVGDAWPLSSEVLAPVLAWYVARDFDAAVKLCIDLNYHGGMGHTASIFSNDDARVREFAGLMNAGRIVVNTPSSQGAVGGTYNMLHPSFTLGCGTGGRNITSDNVTANHLLNIQRIARRRENQRFARFNPGLYFDESLEPAAILAAYNKNY